MEPRPHGCGMPPKADIDGLSRPSKNAKEKPDATLKALKEDLGIAGSILAIWRTLKKLNITRNEKNLHATEQELPRVKRGRQGYRRKVEAI